MSIASDNREFEQRYKAVNNGINITRAARLAKSKGLAVASMGGGYCAVQRVTYDAAGASTVDTLTAWLTGAQALEYLNSLKG